MAVLTQDSGEELNEFVYSVDANLKLFSLPFISSLLQLQSCLPENIYKYFDNQKESRSASLLERDWLNLEHPEKPERENYGNAIFFEIKMCRRSYG